MTDRLTEALLNLPTRQAQVLLYGSREGWTYGMVAIALDRSRGEVLADMRTALTCIRTMSAGGSR